MNNVLEVKENKEEVARISSREVAEMLEMNSKDAHRDLIRKIEKLSVKIESEKVPTETYWIESTYISRGKSYKEYLVSKQGCEFLAHKSTGSKGVSFTIAYMKRFAEYEAIAKAAIEIQNRPSYMIEDPIERATKWIKEYEEKALLKKDNDIKSKEIETLKPKAEGYDTFIKREGLYTVKDIAKMFGIKHLGRNNFYKYLRDNKIIFDGYELYQVFIDRGYGKQEIIRYKCSNDKVYEDSICKFTKKGIDYLFKKLKKEGHFTQMGAIDARDRIENL